MSKAEAIAQAKAVNAYWAPHGLDPEAKPTLVNGHWTVRSNMVGTGWPAKRLDTPDDTPQRDADRHGPVDATRGGGRVMFHDLKMSEVNAAN